MCLIYYFFLNYRETSDNPTTKVLHWKSVQMNLVFRLGERRSTWCIQKSALKPEKTIFAESKNIELRGKFLNNQRLE